jgi:hypothetical protein
MAVVVGKCIQDDEVILAPVKNVVVFVPLLGGLVAEYAALRLLAQNVIDSPGGP